MQEHARQRPFGGLPGVAYWQHRLEEECARAPRHKRPFVLLLIAVTDGDHHRGAAPASEGVMALAAESLRHAIRACDVLCRLAPNRFGVMLIETETAGAQVVVQRLRELILRDIARCLPPTMMPSITISQASFARDGSTPAELMSAARAATTRRPESKPAPIRSRA